MQIEINHQQRQAQESFKNHHNELSDCFITNVQMELDTVSGDCHGVRQYIRTEKRIFTYEGFTQSNKKFTLTIED